MSDDELQGSHLVRKKSTDKYASLEHHMENFDVETTALHRKLQSKADALRILRKELEQFRVERDQFKLMAETLQLRYSATKRNSDLGGVYGIDGSKSSVGKLLHETRERNIKLTTEVEALKQKLYELQGDIDLLRSKEYRAEQKQRNKEEQGRTSTEGISKEELQWKVERTTFICHLENLKKKNAQLSFDFKAIIDEKEELITERDAYKCKAHRLNHELLSALKANKANPKFLDIDGIILENKFLQERLNNFENELDLTKQSANKYKTMLEAKRKKGIMKLGSNSPDESILSHKQVKTMLESGIDLPTRTETIQDLKSLCLALLDNLNDKNLALSHQKKTNKILATKICDLEQRIQLLSGFETNSSCGYAPSQILLHGYCPSLVDSNETNGSTATTRESKLDAKCPATDDSGTMTSEIEESNNNSNDDAVKNATLCSGRSGGSGGSGGSAVSDDNMSSLSTESGRSILSSEYAMDMDGSCNIRDLTSAALYAYKTPSTTTDSGTYALHTAQIHSFVPQAITKERIDDLKDLPPELAAMVQKALHELDMRDFDEVVGGCEEGFGEEATEQYANDDQDIKAEKGDQFSAIDGI